MNEFHFRANDDLTKKIKEEAKNKGISINDFITSAIEHYLTCQNFNDKDKEPSLKLIVTKYSGKCSKCSNHIDIGNLAYYGKTDSGKPILLCLDCMINSQSDRALALRYVRMRQLEKTIKALRKEAESYLSKLEDLQILNKFDSLYQINDELSKMIMSYLKNSFINDDERKALEDVLEQLKENKRTVRDIEDFIQSRFRMQKPNEKRKITYEL
jgi:pyruvate/2-oxoacid:ferredoxin oxidoreductase beta subunit